jgi:hypothetical protein
LVSWRELLVPRYRNKTAAITAMTSIAGTTTGGTNQANIAFLTFGREARREAGPPFFLNSRAVYFCWSGLSLLGCGAPWFCCGVGAGVAGFCGSEDEF